MALGGLFRKLLTRIILKLISRYLKGQTESDLSVRLASGKLALRDAVLRPEPFVGMSMAGKHGWELKSGSVDLVTMRLDRSQVLDDKPFYITVEGVHLAFVPTDSAASTPTADPAWVKRRLESWLAQDLSIGLQQEIYGMRKLVQYLGTNRRSRLFFQLMQSTQLFVTDVRVSWELPSEAASELERAPSPLLPRLVPGGDFQGCSLQLELCSLTVTGDPQVVGSPPRARARKPSLVARALSDSTMLGKLVIGDWACHGRRATEPTMINVYFSDKCMQVMSTP